MEGKACLFKKFAGIDVFDIELAETDPDKLVEIIAALEPTLGGINLEDIKAPDCFYIERKLRERMKIPVFHDDQHGTAIVCLAALRNALKVVGKNIEDVHLVMSGAGAAGTAVLKLLMAAGLKHAVVADQRGVIFAGREDIAAESTLEWVAEHTNEHGQQGTLKEAMKNADVFIGVSAANVIDADDVATMADRSIVFALANPNPEIEPSEAARFAAVVATGRSDFPNQINNVLAFPGFFRGLLDAGAHQITEKMLLAAAGALASCVEASELNASYIVPSVFHPDVAAKVASAVRSASGK
jgi:malate dehydrogenase (oxaloacetate-decarboxylating)